MQLQIQIAVPLQSWLWQLYVGWPDEYFEYGGAVHNMYVGADKKIDVKMVEPTDGWKRNSIDNLMGHMKKKSVEPYYLCHIQEWFKLNTGKDWMVTA